MRPASSIATERQAASSDSTFVRRAFILILVTAAAMWTLRADAQTVAIVGVVRDAHGSPLEGARVEATGEEGRGGVTRTGGDGQFSLGGLTPGVYAVRVARIGSRAWSSDTVRVTTGEADRKSVV